MFVILALMAYLTLRILMTLLSPQVYLLVRGSLSLHKDIDCSVIQTSKDMNDTNLVILNTAKDYKDVPLCHYCVWRPVILNTFGIVILICLLILIKRLNI